MPDNVEVTWYTDAVIALIEKATIEALDVAAFEIAGEAQMNIRNNNQIDTGFMVNSVYAVSAKGSGFSAAKSRAEAQTTSSKSGTVVDHSGDMAPEERSPSMLVAMVVVGASYAIYQELKKPFLYPAAHRVIGVLGGKLTAVYQRVVR